MFSMVFLEAFIFINKRLKTLFKYKALFDCKRFQTFILKEIRSNKKLS